MTARGTSARSSGYRCASAPTRCSTRSSLSSMTLSVAVARRRRRAASARRTRRRPRARCAGVEVQAELAAPPEHVVGAARPFVVVQVGAARPRTGRARPRAPSAAAAEHAVDARAVGARQAVQQRRRRSSGWRGASGLHEALEVGVGPARRADPARSGRRRAGGAPRGPGAAPRSTPSGSAQQVGGLLGELAEGGDLAAPDREQRRLRCVSSSSR